MFAQSITTEKIKTTNNMKVKLNTKSNFENLNGQWLEVVEMKGKRVSVKRQDAEANGGFVISDFTISECAEFDYSATA